VIDAVNPGRGGASDELNRRLASSTSDAERQKLAALIEKARELGL
jgi:hypothetical protein